MPGAMSSFVHLNVHTHYSVLQGMCSIPKLAKACAGAGMPGLAITDNANLFGCMEFKKACEAEKIKPIVGMTAYVAKDHTLHQPQEVRVGHRLVLLARNHQGYKTLCRLSSIGYTKGFYFKPRIDRELLLEHHEGLLLLSGGMGGEIQHLLSLGKWEQAVATVEFYRELVGEEHYYLEIQRTGIDELKQVEPELLRLSRETGVPLVATNDVYYIHKNDSKPHEVLMCIGQQKTMSEASRPRFSTEEFYLKTPGEMSRLFSDLPQAIENSGKILEKCHLEFPPREYHLPVYASPVGEDIENCFDRLCRDGLKRRYGVPLPETVGKRYEIEKGVIFRTGFPTYFLIVADFIAAARDMGIPVGPGRGSAAGSIVAYALEITDIDPLRFDLLFERFLNEERISMPDIDIDFCQERRKEVIDYVVERYGSENVSMIITFGKMGAKAVLRDVGRVYATPLPEIDKLCKMVPDGPKVTLETAMSANPEFRQAVELSAKSRELFEMARVLEGTVRNVGTHAAGVVISDRDLVEYLPLYKSGETVSTQYTMLSVAEDCGLLKMDFLGLQNLTVIKKTVDMIRENHGVDIDVRRLPLDDPDPYRVLGRGETMGIFQFESAGMQKLLRKAKPDKFEDIIALLALYRPGPLGSGMDKVYVECKHGEREIEYPHAMCEGELAETYGVILYQEQVMRLANKLASFSLMEGDTLRQAMGKKDLVKMMKFKPKFIQGSKHNGIDEESAVRIWDLMEKFGEYGFNKSHSTAYAYVSYQTAYLKVHYPHEFMAALMTCDIRNKDKIAIFREECRRLGIPVLPPHVNESNFDFRVIKNSIRYGLGGAKGVGLPAVEAIAEARSASGPFANLEDFVNRVDLSRCGKTAIEALIKCGAFDDLGAVRCQMFAGLQSVMQMAQAERRKTEQGQMMLFAIEEYTEASKTSTLPLLPEWPERDKLAREKEILGFYVSSHPLVSVENSIRHFSSHTIPQLGDLEDNSEVCIGGLLSQCQQRYYKENKKMIRFHIEDLSSSLDVVYFCPDDDRYGALLVDEAIVFIVGKVSRRNEGEISLRAAMVVPVEEAEKKLSGSICLHLDRQHDDEKTCRQLERLLKQYRGSTPVYCTLETAGDRILQLRLGEEFSVIPETGLLQSLAKMIGPECVEIRRAQKSLLGGRRG